MDEDTCFIGQIIPFPSNILPEGWLWCEGQVLEVKKYEALFSVIGNRFGGQGRTFALPDLRGRFPMGAQAIDMSAEDGSYPPALGGRLGAFSTLGLQNLPPHTHTATLEGTVTSGGVRIRVHEGNGTVAIGSGSGLILAQGKTNDSTPSQLELFAPKAESKGTLAGVSGGTGTISKQSFPKIMPATATAGHSEPLPPPPYLATKFAIAYQGTFPVRS